MLTHLRRAVRSPRIFVDALKHLAWTLAIADGIEGKLAVIRSKIRGYFSSATGPKSSPIGIPMHELGGEKLWVRSGTTDLFMAAIGYRNGLHLPPVEARDWEMKEIVELGAYAGGSLAALGHIYPHARLLGVEPDPDNARVARRNLEQHGDRAEFVEAAIWDKSTELAISGDLSFGLVVSEAGDAANPPDATVVKALSIDDLLDRYRPDEEIDFLLMMIEGAEPRVLGAGGRWPERVRSIRVELHRPFGYYAEDCTAQLRALGFEASADPELQGGWAFGVRRS